MNFKIGDKVLIKQKENCILSIVYQEEIINFYNKVGIIIHITSDALKFDPEIVLDVVVRFDNSPIEEAGFYFHELIKIIELF